MKINQNMVLECLGLCCNPFAVILEEKVLLTAYTTLKKIEKKMVGGGGH